MNASSWKKAADLVAKVTPENLQVHAAVTAESQHLQSLLLSALAVDDSRPLQVTYDYQQPIAASTPRATSTEYANDYETAIDEVKYDRNVTNDELKDLGTKDVVLYKRDDRKMTKVKRPIETNDIDDELMRDYDDMRKLMEYRQIHDFYEARRHIQSAMEGDTPVKTGQNRQCIDDVRDYDREHDRILNSVHHRLDLGPNMLLGAQQHTTVESAAALTIQDKIEGKYDENIYSINGQYSNEMYKRAENVVPQLDGTYNVSDDSDIDSHSYLDLASSNIIAHRT